ncbi:hypothetical protein [Aeoliella sp.]|uniref:hypothetical protein n=1 Tax=Aeoliella sp. TaxID=2795800 RepID=UPI003CCC1405
MQTIVASIVVALKCQGDICQLRGGPGESGTDVCQLGCRFLDKTFDYVSNECTLMPY